MKIIEHALKNNMKLKTLLLAAICSFNYVYTQNQINNFKEKFELPIEVKETSGLLFLDGKIITHNDSGNAPNLYELDSLSGAILRTVTVSNATNIDWEDLAENDTHIFIADIGNNNGNRNDLKIFKILKSDFKNNTAVSAEIISYSYEDQTDFSNQPNSSNFDAEGIVIYGNDLLVFTKNWADFKTNVYKIPLTSGNYIATKVSAANVEGLITSAIYIDDRFFLTGYNTSLIPFLIYIDFNRMPGEDIFSSGFNRISLENKLEQGSQVEAITNIGFTGNYYISRENVSTTVSGTRYTLKQKLYQFYDANSALLAVHKNELALVKISPNPIIDKIRIKTSCTFYSIEIYNAAGESICISRLKNQKEVDISALSAGIYYLKIQLKDTNSIIRKIIKL
jgi:hypothetical protein